MSVGPRLHTKNMKPLLRVNARKMDVSGRSGIQFVSQAMEVSTECLFSLQKQ